MKTLLLTSSYEPIWVVHWTTAVRMWYCGKVEILEEYDKKLRSPSTEIRVPAVIKLVKTFKIKNRRPAKLSRLNVFIRDKQTCQYCNTSLTLSSLTYDHVLPRAKGGRTNWKNIVAACRRCNKRKGDRSPREAGMELNTQPKRPTWLPPIKLKREKIPTPWVQYLDWFGFLPKEL